MESYIKLLEKNELNDEKSIYFYTFLEQNYGFILNIAKNDIKF